MKKLRPAVSRASAFIEKLTGSSVQNGQRLPTLDMLARDAGVSRVTMHKALQSFIGKGILTAVRGGGIQVVSPVMPDVPSRISKTRAGSLRNVLDKEILEGTYCDARFLPSLKDLCRRYGAAYRTMRKAISALEIDGIVCRDAVHYRITRSEIKSSSGHIVLVIDSFILATMQWGYMAPRVMLFLSHLENVCRERNVRLIICPANEIPRSGGRMFRDSFGIIAWAAQQEIIELTTVLAGFSRPLVIVDVHGQMELTRELLECPWLSVYRIADVAAGSRLARYLIDSGHRRIGFFSYEKLPLASYAVRRYEGVCREFEKTGIGRENVILFNKNTMPGSGKRPIQSSPLQSLLDESLTRIMKMDIARDMKLTFEERFRESGFIAGLQNTMTPCFEAAMEDRTISAWIAEGDSLAAYGILPFARQRHIHIPGQLSVAGFDNTALSIQHNLTVADFRIHHCVYTAFDTIMSYASLGSRRPRRAVIREIEPVITVRRTTGKAPG